MSAYPGPAPRKDLVESMSVNRTTHGATVAWLSLALGAPVVLVAVGLTVSPATIAWFDAVVTRAADALPFAPLLGWSHLISDLAATRTALVVTGVAATLLLATRHWRGALMLALAVALSQPVVHGVKLLISRPRPAGNDLVAQASGFSFPSAHSATSMALYATLTLIVAQRCQGSARAAVALAGASVVLAVGLSRVYLGAHYPSDVIAGWLTGAVLVTGSWLLVRRLAPGARPAPS